MTEKRVQMTDVRIYDNDAPAAHPSLYKRLREVEDQLPPTRTPFVKRSWIWFRGVKRFLP
jgi:hypothetical protein